MQCLFVNTIDNVSKSVLDYETNCHEFTEQFFISRLRVCHYPTRRAVCVLLNPVGKI